MAIQGYRLSAYEAPLFSYHCNWHALVYEWNRALSERQHEFTIDARTLLKRPREEELVACWLDLDDDEKPASEPSSISSGDLTDSPDVSSRGPPAPKPSIEPSVELFKD